MIALICREKNIDIVVQRCLNCLMMEWFIKSSWYKYMQRWYRVSFMDSGPHKLVLEKNVICVVPTY